MNWLLPASIATAGGVLFLCLANLYLYHQCREKFMGFWALSWGVYFLRFLCMIWGQLAGDTFITRAGYYLLTISAAILLLHGTLLFLGKQRKLWTMWTTLPGIGIGAWVVTALSLQLPPIYVHVPVFEFLGVIGIYCGICLLREGKAKQERAVQGVGWIFIVWGVHQTDYPLLRPIAWFAPWGYTLGAVLAFSIAIGLIVMHFERVQRILREMTMSTAALGGEQLFSQITKAVASLFGARYVMFGRLSADHKQVETLAVWVDGRLADNLIYSLDGTPWEETVRLDFCLHPSGVKTIFPRDVLLQELAAEGYMGVCLHDQNGTPIGLLAVLDDKPLHPSHNDCSVLDYFAARAAAEILRIEMEQHARVSDERFRHLAESFSDWIWEVDTRCVYTYASPKVEAILGYSAAEVLGKTPFDFMPPDEAERVRLLFNQLASWKQPLRDLENWNITRDGRRICLLTNGVPIFDQTGELLGYRGLDRDITENKERMRKTMQMGRLTALGEMASGVAHEINNPINGIVNCAQLLQSRLPEEDATQGIVTRILREGFRISRIVNSLLSVAHPGRQGVSQVNFYLLVNDVLALFEGQMARDGIEVIQDISSEIPSFPGERQQLEQLVLNLLGNARYALNDRLPQAQLDKCLTIRAWASSNERVFLEVYDQGAGIRREHLDRIFTPFFTTKPAGVGTGLGLGLCHEIVRRHGGEIRVESEFGNFTRVTVELPLNASVLA